MTWPLHSGPAHSYTKTWIWPEEVALAWCVLLTCPFYSSLWDRVSLFSVHRWSCSPWMSGNVWQASVSWIRKNQHARLSADFRTSSSHSVSYLLETSTEFLQIFQWDDVFELSAGVSFCPSVSIHWLMWLTSACLIFVSQHPHGSRTNPVGYGVSFEHSDHQSTKKTADGCVGSVTRCATSLLTVTLSPNATDVSRVSGMM